MNIHKVDHKSSWFGNSGGNGGLKANTTVRPESLKKQLRVYLWAPSIARYLNVETLLCNVCTKNKSRRLHKKSQQ